MLVDESLPQLRFLLWNRASFHLTEAEAFDLYESQRVWVDPAAMSPHERRFFDHLVITYGRGVFLGRS